MPPIRWLLMFTILIIKDVTGASVAEEINFEVSNMRELAKNHSQIQELDRTEYDQDDSTKNDFEDLDIAPSEVVETHVLPEETLQEEVNSQMKRPRRRRRRRRRKRPKHTASPDDVASYYSASEEETKRKPIKYRVPETSDEIPQETSIAPRRRNPKRRRRPHKRPIPDDIIPSAEEISEQTNATVNESQEHADHHEQQIKTPPDLPERIIPYSSKPNKLEQDHFAPNTDKASVTESEIPQKPLKDDSSVPDYGLNQDQQFVADDTAKIVASTETQFGKTLMPDENRKVPLLNEPSNRASNTAFVFSKLATQEDEITIMPKRRKRPFAKVKNVTEIDSEKHEGELQNAETKSYNNNFRKTGNKFNYTENTNSTTEDTSRGRNAGKKDGIKIRRLPPTSAILRHVKIRPLKKNETQYRNEEHFNNEIISINETTTARTEPRDPTRSSPYLPTNVPEEEGNDQLPSEKVLAEEENFESLIIKHTTELALRSTSPPFTTTSTTSSTTENTAFIYIPCNHTLNEVLKHKLNLTSDNVTLTSKFYKYSNSTIKSDPLTTEPADETADVFKSVAMEELEKLLQQVKSETTSTTSSTTAVPKHKNVSRNSTPIYYDETVDSSESEVSQNYGFRFHNINPPKTRIFQPHPTAVPENHNREPKWYQDYTKVPRDSKERKYENSFTKSSTPDKELILLYTSTPNPNLVYNDVDSDEFSLHVRNNTFPGKYYKESLVHRSKSHAERKKLPLAVKSAIIISGAILALAVLGFFALLLSCKIRQAKSRMKCHRELYRENLHNSEFRQSSRSTSPVMSKSNYNGRNFANNMQANMASTRNYYLWQTLRKTFQYD